jgi:hypothetical protein
MKRWEQGSIAIIFVLLIILWVTRDPVVVPGWGSLFTPLVNIFKIFEKSYDSIF